MIATQADLQDLATAARFKNEQGELQVRFEKPEMIDKNTPWHQITARTEKILAYAE